MNETDHDALQDILKACDTILRFTQDATNDDLYGNEMLALALVRLVEIVGEATRRLSQDLTASHPEVEWGNMIGTRNRLIHGYFDVDLDIVWSIVVADIPPLRACIQQMLAQRD